MKSRPRLSTTSLPGAMFDGSFLEPSNPATHHFTRMHLLGGLAVLLVRAEDLVRVLHILGSNEQLF